MAMRHLNRLLERHARLIRARELRANPTPGETRTWQMLRGKRIGGLRFRRQHVFGRFILDFYCPAKQLCIEVDGSIDGMPEQATYDRARDEALAELGVTVIRISRDHLSEETLRRVLEPYCDRPPPHEMRRGEGWG